MNAIFRRRSIRKYTSDTVSDDLIKKLLEAGMSAPSAGNERPWQFVVIKDKKTLAKLADASPHAKMTKDAPVAILVCGDLELTFRTLTCSISVFLRLPKITIKHVN
jgi:nitroreductase